MARILCPHSSDRVAFSRGVLSALRPLAWATAALLAGGQLVAAEWTVVASGLNNPRGLDFAPNGALYVAEAGTGGSGPSIPGPDGLLQYGMTGSVTRVFKGKQERVATGLPSLASPGGFGAIGPSAISFGPSGHAQVTIGLGQDPEVRDLQLPASARGLGVLYQMTQNGQMKRVADLAAYEGAYDPDGNGPDSNPNGVLADAAGGTYVADAGANALVHVDAASRISTVAVFPNRIVPTPPFLPQPPFPPALSMQAVPTNVVRGPDGALYVSQLTGFPFPVGGARVYRVVPGSAPTIYAEGFTNIIDLEFDAWGNLYVLEINATGLLSPFVEGRLARVNAGSGTVDTIAAQGLVMPGGMKIGPDHAIYVSNFSIAPGVGEVVRIVP